jgi:hypothetical protein
MDCTLTGESEAWGALTSPTLEKLRQKYGVA